MFRERTADLWEAILKSAATPGGPVPAIVLIGQSGEGKSTLLMRVAASMTQSGIPHVYFHRPDAVTISADEFSGLPPESSVFIFIDDISRFSASCLHDFFTGLHDLPIRPVVVGSAVGTVWWRLGYENDEVGRCRSVKLGGLPYAETHALLVRLNGDLVHRRSYLGNISRLRRREQVSAFREQKHRTVLAALLESGNGKPLNQAVTDALDGLARALGDVPRLACEYVSALHCLNLTMPRAVLERLLPPDTHLDRDVLGAVTGLLRLFADSRSVTTRHPLIADIVFAGLPDREACLANIIAAADSEDEILLVVRMIEGCQLRYDPSLAGRLLALASGRFPKSPLFHHMQAVFAHSEGDTRQARAFFRRAVEADPSCAPSWHAWASMEKGVGNDGSAQDPEPYTARWLYRRAADADPSYSRLWRPWARLEAKHMNIGDADQPEEYSARWLFRRAVQARPRSSWSWHAWSRMEMAQGNIGNVHAPEPGTVRWIYRQSLSACGADPDICTSWAKLEMAEGNIGDPNAPETYTARWLFRKVVEASPSYPPAWLLWAGLEADDGNIGSADDPGLHTARGIFRVATERYPASVDIWHAWLNLEMAQGNIGDTRAPEKYTVRWLFRVLAELRGDSAEFWGKWARLEKEQGNIGDYPEPDEHTFLWIAVKAANCGSCDTDLLLNSARVETRRGNQAAAERFYRKALPRLKYGSAKREAHRAIAETALASGRLDEAVEHLETIICDAPHDSVARALAGVAYGRQCRWEEAEEQFRESLRLMPDDAKTQEWYDDMLRARERYEHGSGGGEGA